MRTSIDNGSYSEPEGSPKAPISTLSSIAYERLRREIIHAIWLPGQKLRIASLCERYQIGPSPMREALNRLAHNGLVEHSEQRGFYVSPVSDTHLASLTKTRCWLNELALRDSISHGDQKWEEHIVLSYHRLSRQVKMTPSEDSEDRNVPWENAHRAFHSSLLAACESPWLLGYCEQLFDEADRYRHLSRLVNANYHVRTSDEHQALMQATIERRVDNAVNIFTEHLNHTAELVRKCLESERGWTSGPHIPPYK